MPSRPRQLRTASSDMTVIATISSIRVNPPARFGCSRRASVWSLVGAAPLQREGIVAEVMGKSIIGHNGGQAQYRRVAIVDLCVHSPEPGVGRGPDRQRHLQAAARLLAERRRVTDTWHLL